jgi:Predicted symporter
VESDAVSLQEVENAKRAAAAVDVIRQANASYPATMTPEQICAANGVILAEVGKRTELNELFAEQPRISTELVGYDHNAAFPILMKKLLSDWTGCGLIGFVLAAMFGAIVSSLAAMLNSASTIATIDIYNKLHRGASDRVLVLWGRFFVVLFVGIAIWIAPKLGSPAFNGIFSFIQEFQGFISPGILAVFLFGMFIPWAPRACGVVGLLLSPVIYGICKFACPIAIPGLGDTPVQEWAFLNRMALTFVIVVAVLMVMTVTRPMKRKDFRMPVSDAIELKTSWVAVVFGIVVVVVTGWLYKFFW